MYFKLIASFSGGVVSSVIEAVVSVIEVRENRVVARAHDRLVMDMMPRFTRVYEYFGALGTEISPSGSVEGYSASTVRPPLSTGGTPSLPHAVKNSTRLETTRVRIT